MGPSIILGKHFEDFIHSQVSSGRYSSASEVVRTALSLLEEEESKKELLINALIVGEKSDFDKTFDPIANLKILKTKIE